MHAERDYLIKRVFPELSQWCAERQLNLVDIDLRWGVTEVDAVQNRRVIEICLDRIDRCRPFFLCFMGQRRGWVPDPQKGEICEETFELYKKLRNHLGESATEMEIMHALIDPMHNGTFVDEEGKTRDGKAVEHAFFFRRDKSYLDNIEFKDTLHVYQNEADCERWDDLVIPKIPKEKKPFPYTCQWLPEAATPEIALPTEFPTSALRDSEDWRTALSDWAECWRNRASVEVSPDGTIQGEMLKRAEDYNRRLSKGRLGKFEDEDGQALEHRILDVLQKAIAKEFNVPESPPMYTPLEREINEQEQFRQRAAQGFIPLSEQTQALEAYLKDESDTRICALTGIMGSGKTSCLADWLGRLPNEKSCHVFSRFIGGSEASISEDSLIRSIMEQMCKVYSLEWDIPLRGEELFTSFKTLLADCGRQGKVVLVIDALNQLQSGLLGLDWIPPRLPPGVKLIISLQSDPDNATKLLRDQKDNWLVTEINPKGAPESVREEIIDTYFRYFFKELNPDIRKILVTMSGAETPLFLKIVLQELRVFGSYENMKKAITGTFGNTPQSAFNAVLNRLENERVDAPLEFASAVRVSLGCLAHSRYGLSVEELSLLLMAVTEEEGQKIPKEQRTDARDTVQLILRQLRPYIGRQEGRVYFHYEALKKAVIARYTDEDPSTQWHDDLARFFGGHVRHEHTSAEALSNHALKELVWQLVRADDMDEYRVRMLNYFYLQRRIEQGMMTSVLEDLALCNEFESFDDDEKKSLVLLADALMAAEPYVRNNLKQLPFQLTGRLTALRKEYPVLARFLDDFVDHRTRPSTYVVEFPNDAHDADSSWKSLPYTLREEHVSVRQGAGSDRTSLPYTWLRPLSPCLPVPGGVEGYVITDKVVSGKVVSLSTNRSGSLLALNNLYEGYEVFVTKSKKSLLKSEEPVGTLALSASGVYFVVANTDGTVRCIHLPSRVEQWRIEKVAKDFVKALAVAIADDGQTILLLYSQEKHSQSSKLLFITKDGCFEQSVAVEDRILWWNKLVLTNEGRHLLLMEKDGLGVWDVASRSRVRTFPEAAGLAYDVAHAVGRVIWLKKDTIVSADLATGATKETPIQNANDEEIETWEASGVLCVDESGTLAVNNNLMNHGCCIPLVLDLRMGVITQKILSEEKNFMYATMSADASVYFTATAGSDSSQSTSKESVETWYPRNKTYYASGRGFLSESIDEFDVSDFLPAPDGNSVMALVRSKYRSLLTLADFTDNSTPVVTAPVPHDITTISRGNGILIWAMSDGKLIIIREEDFKDYSRQVMESKSGHLDIDDVQDKSVEYSNFFKDRVNRIVFSDPRQFVAGMGNGYLCIMEPCILQGTVKHVNIPFDNYTIPPKLSQSLTEPKPYDLASITDLIFLSHCEAFLGILDGKRVRVLKIEEQGHCGRVLYEHCFEDKEHKGPYRIGWVRFRGKQVLFMDCYNKGAAAYILDTQKWQMQKLPHCGVGDFVWTHDRGDTSEADYRLYNARHGRTVTEDMRLCVSVERMNGEKPYSEIQEKKLPTWRYPAVYELPSGKRIWPEDFWSLAMILNDDVDKLLSPDHIVISEDGKWFVTVSYNSDEMARCICLWDWKKNSLVAEISWPSEIAWIYVWSNFAKIFVLDTKSAVLMLSIEEPMKADLFE